MSIRVHLYGPSSVVRRKGVSCGTIAVHSGNHGQCQDKESMVTGSRERLICVKVDLKECSLPYY